MFADMPVGLANPRTRFEAIRQQMAAAKRSGTVEGLDSLLENAVFPAAPRSTRRPAGWRPMTPQPAVSTITTNVPGPQKQLYMLGRPMDRMLGYVPLGMNQLITVAIVSYNGQICCGSPRTTTRCPTWKCWPTGSKPGLAELSGWRAEPWTPGIPRRRPRTYRSAAACGRPEVWRRWMSPDHARPNSGVPVTRSRSHGSCPRRSTSSWRVVAPTEPFSGGVAGAEPDGPGPRCDHRTSAGALTGAIMAEDLASGVNRIAYVWGQIGMSHLVGEKWLTRGLGSVRSPGLVFARDRSRDAQVHPAHRADRGSGSRVRGSRHGSGHRPATCVRQRAPHPSSARILGHSRVLPPVMIHDRLYVDGLASANLPAVPAVERGAGSIVVLDTGTREVGEVETSAAKVLARVAVIAAMSQRRRQLRDAAAEVLVLLLPTPADLGGTLEFGNTMRAGAAGYSMTRAFLSDLACEHRRQLGRGIYARPDDHGLTPDLEPMLKAVPG